MCLVSLKPFVRIKIDDSLIDYDSAEALANFKGRVLVLAGKKDKTLPPALIVNRRLKRER